jgi:hypothetical protein
MREVFEFRVDEDFVNRLFREDEGEHLGSVRKVFISRDDERFFKIGELQKEVCNATKFAFFYSWDIYRHYTKPELDSAEAFHLKYVHTFEPCGEECGTLYDESTSCPVCGAGAMQTTDLRLDLRKAPRSNEFARTIAGEIIVSQRLAELMVTADLKGFEFRRVRHKARYEDDPLELSELPSGRAILLNAEAADVELATGAFYVWLNRAENAPLFEQARQEHAAFKRRSAQAKAKPAPVWHQLVPTAFVDVTPPTRTGVDPFDEDEKGEYRCPHGDTLGLNLLSELTISAPSGIEWDVAATRQYFGLRSGVLRPEQRLLVSPRLRRLIEDNDVKGYKIEVAHMA